MTGNGKKAKEQVDLERVSAMFKNDIKIEFMADLTGGTGWHDMRNVKDKRKDTLYDIDNTLKKTSLFVP